MFDVTPIVFVPPTVARLYTNLQVEVKLVREVRDQNLAESLYCVLRKNTLLYKCLFSLRSFNGYRQLSVKLIKCWGGGDLAMV